MNGTIIRLSVQAILGQRRGLVVAVIPAALVVLSFVVRALTDLQVGIDAAVGLGFSLALPLVALLAASAVLGPEVDDGSVVYLLATPVSRHVIATSKFVAAWAAVTALGALPVGLVGLVLDPARPARALALGVGAAVAGTAYTALFLAMAALTRHAVVVGLLFALVWEGVLGLVFVGIRWLSVAAWGREVAGELSPLVEQGGIGVTYAALAATVVTLGGVWFTGERLRSFTLRGDE